MATRKYSWAVVNPYPPRSVRYLDSSLALSAAKQLPCGKYLAIIGEPSEVNRRSAGYLVQSAALPLPDTYLPIFPCKIGERKPLVPDFDWPFGECVINTGKFLVFYDVPVKSDRDSVQRFLSAEAARIFSAICVEDFDEQIQADREKMVTCSKAAWEADGVPDDVSRWTSFSVKSTDVPAPPGEFFPPIGFHARVSYNIDSLQTFLPASECFEDVQNIQRLRARFSRPETERTIIWNMNQAASIGPDPPVERPIGNFPSTLIEFSAALDRPYSPDRPGEVIQPTLASGEFDVPENDSWSRRGLYTKPREEILQQPPPFDPPALEIVYFDVYGTLIDNESGIFDALQPLLAQSPHIFERWEALTFYFESESEVKQRMPAAPYLQILAETHSEMASRLGIPATEDESSSFASSIFGWPLFDGAQWCLQILKPWVPLIVALCDVDHETLRNTSAFAMLAPHFAEVFTWDAARIYRPDPSAFDPPFKYHDDLGIARERRCLVSNGLLRDLEPACALDVPAIWVRYAASLAGGVLDVERAVPWEVCQDLPHLASVILEEKGALALRVD